jgi:hypothetical protein
MNIEGVLLKARKLKSMHGRRFWGLLSVMFGGLIVDLIRNKLLDIIIKNIVIYLILAVLITYNVAPMVFLFGLRIIRNRK